MKQIARWLCFIGLLCTIAFGVTSVCHQLGYLNSSVGAYTMLSLTIGTPILDAIALVVALTQIQD